MHCISNFRKGAFLIAIAMLLFTACSKPSNNSLSDEDDDGGYASDASRIELINNDVISIADVAGALYNGIYLANCATVATDTISIPHTLIVRFGPSECVCLDGRKRKGAIIISYTGRYQDTNKLHTITYDNYYVNGNQLTGFVQTTRIDTTLTGKWFYNVYVNDSLNMSQDPKNSQFVTWRGNLVRRWIKGDVMGAPDRNDDVFTISGAASLTRPNGHTFAVGIASPLQVAIGCDYIQAGEVNVSGLKGGRVLNYGTGTSTCDANAQLNIGVNFYPLVLVK
jgi:hypothetical protein